MPPPLLADFLATQHWVLEVQVHPWLQREPAVAKRQRAANPLFEGFCCFVASAGKLCALVPDDASQADWFATTSRLILSNGALFLSCTGTHERVECRIDHGAVQRVKIGRPLASVAKKRPFWFGFDFGTVELRLWNEHDAALQVMDALCAELEPAPAAPVLRPPRGANSLRLLGLVQLAAADRNCVKESMRDLVKVLKLER